MKRVMWSIVVLATLAGLFTVRAQEPASSMSSSRAKPVDEQTYRDTETGVSFHYFASWKRDYLETEVGFSPPLLLGAGYVPRALFVFDKARRLSIPPQFEGLAFIYAAPLAKSSLVCKRKVQDIRSGLPVDVKPINGRPFFHVSEADGSASHFIETEVFGTFSGSRCVLFERNFDYNDTNGVMRDADLAEFRHELDLILESVRIKN